MKKKLTFKQTILLSGTLFGMFFGAGNLIFPVHLGQLAGSNYLYAMLGFCIIAVGIPVLAVAAIGVTHSSGLQELAGKVSKSYGLIFTCLLYLTIGPFFAIPRCATVSFTTGISPLFSEQYQTIALLIFSLLFFSLVLYFSLKPGNITIYIGKYINPLFLCFLVILLFKVLTGSQGSIQSIEPIDSYATNAFFNSFIEGYGTMDAIAGLAFGIVVIDIIRSWGVTEDSAVAKEVIKAGCFAGLLMGLIYIFIIYAGSASRLVLDVSDNGGIALTEISRYYLGNYGWVVLAVTITAACLKTSIGLVTSCADMFERMSDHKISYKVWVFVFTMFSFVVSNIGLSAIIAYSVPVLMFIYPLTITIILLALTGKWFDHSKKIYVSVTIFTAFAAFFDLMKALPESLQIPELISFAQKFLPLYDLNLGWVCPALTGFIIGLVLYLKDKRVNS